MLHVGMFPTFARCLKGETSRNPESVYKLYLLCVYVYTYISYITLHYVVSDHIISYYIVIYYYVLYIYTQCITFYHIMHVKTMYRSTYTAHFEESPPPPFMLETIHGQLNGRILGVGSPFFSAIVLFKNQPFPLGVWWFSRKIRIPGKNGHGRYP